MKLSEAVTFLNGCFAYNLECYQKGKSEKAYVVPFFVGDPGLGKTAIPKIVARAAGVPYFETVVASYDAGELGGFPFKVQKHFEYEVEENGKMVKKAVDEDRAERLRPGYLPDIHDPEQHIGIFNLDELPQAPLFNLNVVAKLVNEWKVGDHAVSRGVTICATGNKAENKAGTTTLPMHLRDRLTFINIECDDKEWLKWAATEGIDYRIRAFIQNNPGMLHDFKVGQDANPTPRSWEKASAYLSMDLPKHIRTEALAGQIGAGTTSTFETWLRVEDKMPKLEDVINNPLTAPVFTNKDANILYLLLSALADATKPSNVDNVLAYIDRLPNKEFAAVWAADAFNRDKSLLDIRSVTKWKMTTGAKLAL